MICSRDPIPEPPSFLAAPLAALADDLQAWCRQQRDATLEAHEQAVLARVRRALPALLEGVLVASTRELGPDAPVRTRICPVCGGPGRMVSRRPRQVLTVCGTVRLRRRWYRCRECTCGWSPADVTLHLESAARVSPGVRDWITQVGGARSVREAAALLATLTGLRVAPETVRRHALRLQK